MNTVEERIAHWINHRWAIHVAKKNDYPKPWTTDHILQDFRFCNVHRENDAVTRWIADNWRDANSREPNLVPAMVLARMFNLPSTLEAIGFPYEWDLNYMTDKVKTLRSDGHKIFNGAYLITTCGVKMDKVEYVFRVANDAKKWAWSNPIIPTTLWQMHHQLTSIKGIGSFLSAQIIADLKNAPGHPLYTASDRFTWAAPGPGSMRGIARLEKGHRPSKKQFLAVAQAARARVAPLLNTMPAIDMQDFQNCLCEFDKWERTYLGESKPKQRYNGRHPDNTNTVP